VSLTSLEIREAGDILLFRVEGSHFIWKMVRRLVGVIVEVGRGGLTADEAVAMLSSESELPARLTAPASGLFLERVRYDGDPPESEDSYGLLLAGGVMPLKRK
jgi:tRNA pseudouridine38-40 synthase